MRRGGKQLKEGWKLEEKPERNIVLQREKGQLGEERV